MIILSREMTSHSGENRGKPVLNSNCNNTNEKALKPDLKHGKRSLLKEV